MSKLNFGGLGFQGNTEQLLWTQISWISLTVLYSDRWYDRDLACTVGCEWVEKSQN